MAASTLPAEAKALQDAALRLDCPLTSLQVERLLAYVALLMKWSRTYNLTAIDGRSEMLSLHVLDCLSIVAPIKREMGGQPFRLLDVGSGAGLPGVIVATVLEYAQVTCVDAVAKKAGFVRQVVGELTLGNLHSQHARIEDFRAPSFGLVTARAFASLSELVSLTDRHLAPSGAWVAMKGRRPNREIDALPKHVEAFHVEQLRIPDLNADRCLVWMQRKGEEHPALRSEGS